MNHFEKIEKELPTPRARRIYSLLPKDQKILVIKSAFGLTHGKGKRKKKRRKK